VCFSACIALAIAAGAASAVEPPSQGPGRAPRKIVVIAGKKSHGPEGNGIHDYPWSVRLIKVMLDNSNVADRVRTEFHLDGWPRDEKTLDDADAIMVISDGRDGELYEEAPHFHSPEQTRVIARQIARGCGFLTFHFSTFAPDKFARQILDWSGGYFDWETDGKRQWYSAIATKDATVTPAAPDHPALRGVKPFRLREEFYYNIRFDPADRALVPIWTASGLGGRPEMGNVVAWARQRPDGGRGFGTTCGHFYDNWKHDDFRRTVLNALVWAARAEVPPGGVDAPFFTHEEIAQALAGVEATRPARLDRRPIRALIFAGNAAHKWHNWQRTTPAIKAALERDPRIKVDVSLDFEDLARKRLGDYQVIVQNYANWLDPRPPSDASKRALIEWLTGGGGLIVIHFANGAFHFSLPMAGASDWPEYRKIVPRVWNHQGAPDQRSGHDAFGPFRVQIGPARHAITEGLEAFDVIDELYFRQAGDAPIEPLLSARSKATGRDEPLAWTASYGRGRVFQILLGHSEKTYDAFAVREILRRSAAWAADRPIRRFLPAQDGGADHAEAPRDPRPAPPAAIADEGRFGKALDARRAAAIVGGRPEYRQAPLSIDCWARLFGKGPYNILLACDTKASGEHWELFTVAGTGKLAFYMPGRRPDHVHSAVDICDGRWHHVACRFEPDRVRLIIDGRQAADERIERTVQPAVAGDLAIGRLVEGGFGCDGLIDDARLTHGDRAFAGAATDAAKADAHTIGLWSFDSLAKGGGVEGAQVDDLSPLQQRARLVPTTERPANPQAVIPPAGVQLAAVDPRLKVELIDRSESDVLMAVRPDGEGRLFVGGRDAAFVYEPDPHGGYRPKRELLRLPGDSIVIGLELRGDDLYVLTGNALYLVPGARLRRDALRPRRLLWGLPLDLHISFHCLAWGPQGDLYLNHGDPLLNYGDDSRPDHWGHWTLFSQDGATRPYTGVGAVLRMKPDGRDVQFIAGGLRGPVGLAFDPSWNLFTNDNDHESLPDLFAPARLLHVSPHVDFAWPRGWMASKSPDRHDLLEPMIATLGRGVPCDLVYYDDAHLPATYRRSILMCRWDRLGVFQYPVRPRGASLAADEKPFLAGKSNARPVGIAVGRGGRLFVTMLYLSGNVGSPACVSDLVMVSRADDPPGHPFEPLDVTSAPADRLWSELACGDWDRRHRAHVEILRRGGPLFDEAVRRLNAAADEDPAISSLIPLAAACGKPDVLDSLRRLVGHANPDVRLQAVRALADRGNDAASTEVFAKALRDADPRAQLAALAPFFDRPAAPPWDRVWSLAASDDTYLRQTAVRLIAARAELKQIEAASVSEGPDRRLAAILAAGIRLTVPGIDFVPPASLPLTYRSGNAFFRLRFADSPAEVDLRELGRTGSFTTAEWWRAIKPTAQQRSLCELLVRALDDPEPAVSSQAAFYLDLLRDPRSEPLVAAARRRAVERRLAAATPRPVGEIWEIGPFDSAELVDPSRCPSEDAAPDLKASFGGSPPRTWQRQVSIDGVMPFAAPPRIKTSATFCYFQLSSASRQKVLLDGRWPQALVARHNGRPVDVESVGDRHRAILDLQPGSNDVLLRCQAEHGSASLRLTVSAIEPCAVVLPDPIDSSMLRRRLSEAAASGSGAAIPSVFAAVDWEEAMRRGNADAGRRLFGSLSCAKCHAVAAEQRGNGAPSLAEARKRFSVAHVVESILMPSRQVAEPFRASTVVTSDGQVLNGLIVTESAAQIEILLADATRKTVATADIEARRRSELSPMPVGLVKTPAELSDLLAYLLSANPTPP
jgi:putative heme-binding domain-containing protein